ncbi:hypothetical protein BsWGS_00085 [Bradybaena similaris]
MSTSAHPVDHGWAWMVMIGSFGVHFLSFGYIRSFGILFLEFQARFQASSAMTAVVVGVQFCVYSISTFLVVNVVLKRFSVRQSCLLGCCLQSLGIFLNGIVPDILYLLFTQGLLFGIGLALLYCPALIIISQYFNEKRAISTAIAASGVSAGGVTLPFLMRYFVENYGLAGGLMLLSAVMFNQTIFVALFTPPSQYTFVTSRTPQDESAKQYSSSVHGEGSDHGEESISLLQQHPNGSQISTQPVGSLGVALSGGWNTGETTRRDSQGRELHCGIANSVLDRKFDESVESSSQIQPLPNHSPSPNQPKAGTFNQNETNQGDELKTSQVASFVHKEQPQRHSLKDSVLRVLSTSGTDLYCSLHDVNSQRISPSAGDHSSRDTSNAKLDANKAAKWTKRWRCRVPPVARTLSFWALLVFFACGGAGSGLPPIYIPPLAKEKDMNDKASFLLMMSAVTEVIGRMLPGVILHFGIMGPCTVLIAPLTACATLYQFTAFYNDFSSLLAMSLLIGLFSGSFWTMQSLVVIDIYGLERLGPLLGFYVLVVGLSMGASNPFSGFLRDVSGSYSVTFHFFGIMYYIAVLMVLAVLLLKRLSSKKSLDVASSSEDIPLRSPLNPV